MTTVRPYDRRDLAAVVRLVRDLQAHEAALFDRMKPAGEMGAWYVDLLEKWNREEHGTLLVAEENGEVVGYATILTNVVEDGTGDEASYSYASVGDLVTSESMRGRGIGKLLLEECERRARLAGRDELRITMLAKNERARDVYKKFGFDDLLVDMSKKLA